MENYLIGMDQAGPERQNGRTEIDIYQTAEIVRAT